MSKHQKTVMCRKYEAVLAIMCVMWMSVIYMRYYSQNGVEILDTQSTSSDFDNIVVMIDINTKD